MLALHRASHYLSLSLSTWSTGSMNILIVSIHLFSLLLVLAQLTVSNTAGYEDTVLWSPYGNEGMGYNNFVCVESVKVRQSAWSTPFCVCAFINSPIQKTHVHPNVFLFLSMVPTPHIVTSPFLERNYLKVRSGDPRGRRFVDGRHVLGRRRCLVADCFEYGVEKESLQQKLNLPENLYLQAKTISLQLSLTWVICKDNHPYLFKSDRG